ncbi:MAG: DUF616 domain-containing protein [Methylococcales bacterium]|nr:DUF616 domain-containing protein [Methylococcales bacterium]
MKNNLKIAVYTCITGDYDTLIQPSNVDSRLDYFCFTDNDKQINSPWLLKSMTLPELDNKDKNRYVKMHPHIFFPDYDITIYIDGNVGIVGDLYELAAEIHELEGCFFAYAHAERNCVYSEAAACGYFAHDWIWRIAKQMRKYSINNYPMNNGLVSANILIRKNNSALVRLMDAWWSAYSSGVKRDQLSLPFVSWQHAISITYLGKNDFRYFQVVKHSIDTKPLKKRLRKHLDRAVTFVIPYQKLFAVPLAISRKKPFHTIN